MGDQIGEVVSGKLYSVSKAEFNRILDCSLDDAKKTELFAAICRINVLYMIAKAGSGHIGSSFSSMEIMSYFYLNEVYRSGSTIKRLETQDPNAIFFSSKGHDSPALYSALIGLGVLDEKNLGRLRQFGGLPGHPDVGTTGVITNTGSLGMGVSKAKGFIQANRLREISKPVYVLTGDGELQEGQFWESLSSAANHKMHELTVVIDHNKLQSDTLVSKVSDLGDIEAKLRAFGCRVERCDGNDVVSIDRSVAKSKDENAKPTVIIADTVKGKGVSFMEHTSIDSDVENYKFHSGAPTADNYKLAIAELLDGANQRLEFFGLEKLALDTEISPNLPKSSGREQRLIAAYSDALISVSEKHQQIVALDADLILDTGLIPFAERFPDRFFECGIAEQDMVSQAGAFALSGMLPIVHSFACFLSSRPREQIYNNCSERTKVVYVGSLAGLLPGGPGHSHQGVSDIGTLGHIPGMSIVVPGFEADVRPLLEWAVEQNSGSCYIRLESIPVSLETQYEPNPIWKTGQGLPLNQSSGIKLLAYGPTMLAVALEVAEKYQNAVGQNIQIINFPWINKIDEEWFSELIDCSDLLVCLDNHFYTGGLGDRIASMIAGSRTVKIPFLQIGLDDIPVCGKNDEVLRHHNMDAPAIVSKIKLWAEQ